MLYWVDSGGNPTYRLTDGLGSMVALANASGAVTESVARRPKYQE